MIKRRRKKKRNSDCNVCKVENLRELSKYLSLRKRNKFLPSIQSRYIPLHLADFSYRPPSRSLHRCFHQQIAFSPRYTVFFPSKLNKFLSVPPFPATSLHTNRLQPAVSHIPKVSGKTNDAACAARHSTYIKRRNSSGLGEKASTRWARMKVACSKAAWSAHAAGILKFKQPMPHETDEIEVAHGNGGDSP